MPFLFRFRSLTLTHGRTSRIDSNSATLRSMRRPKSALDIICTKDSRVEVQRERSTLAQARLLSRLFASTSGMRGTLDSRAQRPAVPILSWWANAREYRWLSCPLVARVPVTMCAMFSLHNCNRYQVQCARIWFACHRCPLSTRRFFDQLISQACRVNQEI